MAKRGYMGLNWAKRDLTDDDTTGGMVMISGALYDDELKTETMVTPSSDLKTKQECGESYDNEVGIKYDDEMTMVSRTRCGDNCVGSVDSHSEDRNDEEVIPGTQGDDEKLPGTPSSDNGNTTSVCVGSLGEDKRGMGEYRELFDAK